MHKIFLQILYFSVSSEKTGKRKAEEELLKESSIKKTNIEKSGFFFNTPSTVTSKRKAEDELLKESPIKKANNKKLEDKLNSPVAKSYWVYLLFISNLC